jgi:hypothetical protein
LISHSPSIRHETLTDCILTFTAVLLCAKG